MVKQLITKRKNKDLTVEQYWEYRQQFKTSKPSPVPQTFVDEEAVLNRHRFKKHKDLVNTFDPLEGVGEQVLPPFKTHTFDLMDKIQTMPRQLSGFRSKCLSLPLIQNNLSQIYEILFNNLNLDDSWEFLLTILRDTKDKSFSHILSRLGDLTYEVAQGFVDKVFRRIFKVLSVFFEVAIKSIEQNIVMVWQAFENTLFIHQNKYIRKFSASSFRYVLDRLQAEQYNEFVSSFLDQDLSDLQVEALSEALFSQLKFFKGFLTQESIKRLETMWGLLSNQIISHITIKLINRMSSETNDHSFVFDLNDLTLLVVNKFKNNPECSIHYFLTLFSKHPNIKTNKKIKQHLNELVRNLFDSQNKPQIFADLLVTVILMNNQINDKQYKYLKQLNLEGRVNVLERIKQDKSHLNSRFLMTLVALFTNQLKQFLINGENVVQVFSLLLILDTHHFNSKLSLSVSQKDIKQINAKELSYERLLVLLKIFQIIDIEQTEALKAELDSLSQNLNNKIVEYCTNEFPLGVFISFGDNFPVLHRINILKKQVSKLASTQNIELNDKSQGIILDSLLEKFNSNKLILLRNKVRKLRFEVLEQLKTKINEQLYETLRGVDSENVDVHNERDVKQVFLRLREKAIQKIDIEVLINWSIGFAFTGFNQISDSFIEFLGKFIETNSQAVKSYLLEFLELMNFKMSRTFKDRIAAFVENNKDEFYVIEDDKFLELLNESHPVQKNEALEKIGYQRITKTLHKFPRIKNKISTELTQLLQKYFKQEFYRDSNNIQQYKKNPKKDTALPLKQPGPHPHHLSVMLNLVPSTYIPTYDCLHFSEDLCPILESKSLKTQPWEKQWHKSNKVVENGSTLFNLPKQEHRVYLNFLWRLVLSSNQTDRDRIFDHLNQTDLDLEYLLNIHYGELFLNGYKIQAMSSQQLVFHLSLVQESKLLAFQQRTKSFIKSLKAKIAPYLPILTKLIIQIINLGEDTSIETTANYKSINKQSIKVLLLIFQSYHTESIEVITKQILTSFKQKIENLHNYVTSGIPGVLRLIQMLSSQSHLSHLFTEQIIGPVSLCYKNKTIYGDSLKALNTIFLSLLELEAVPLSITNNAGTILEYIFVHVSSKHITEEQIVIIKYLSNYVTNVSENYVELFVNEILSTLKTKKKSGSTKERRTNLLDTLFSLSQKCFNSSLYKNLIYYIPELQSEQQKQLRDIISNSFQQSVVPSIIGDVTAIKIKGLITEPDYDRVFKGLNELKRVMGSLKVEQKEFIAFSILNLGKNTELAVINSFVEIIKAFTNGINGEIEEQFVLLRKVTKSVLSLLLTSSKSPDTFRVYIRVVDEILTSIKSKSIDIGNVNKQALELIHSDTEQSFFKLIGSLSESKKLSGLKILMNRLQNWSVASQRLNFPNLITSLLLPILQHMIYKKNPTGNLSDSLNVMSTKAYGACFKCVEPSQIKQILKKMVRNIKFEEVTATNLTIVQTISAILDNIEKEANVLPQLAQKIRQEGVDTLNVKNHNDEEDEIEEYDYQLEDAADVEMNYTRYDKKMIDTEMNEEQTANTSSSLLLFLRKHILTNLKSLLFYKLKTSTSSKKDKEEKSRIFLTVVITKLLKKLSLKIFLVEFHKIVTKLCRLLKSRDDDSRDNARKCLLEILKITGPELIYVVVRELKFQLKQDFERHVLNYTIHYILDQLDLKQGTLDYCIPLIIPCAFEEAIGVLSKQKQLVDANQIPIKLFQMKKKKGMLIFKVVGRVISVDKINFLVNSLKQEFNKHGVSESNNQKFNQIIDHILSGLQKNETLQTNSKTLLSLFSTVIELTTVQLTEDSLTQNTVLQTKRKFKTTNKQIFELQQQAAQGKSIFKKINNELKLKKNKNQLEYMIYNFWLSLLQISIKKGIINEELLKSNKELAININKFIVSCLQSIDNRIVGKSLKVVENIIRWKNIVNKEKVQNLVIDKFEKLTLGDETLIRISFKIILVTYQEMKINPIKLRKFFDFIQLSIHDEILEAYQLFRSILNKQPTRSQIPQFMQVIKQKMVSSFDQDINKISRDIYLAYFTKVISQQPVMLDEGVNYILTNIQCKQQLSRKIVLQALENIINWLIVNNKTAFGYFSNIIFFQLVVAHSNQTEVYLKDKIKNIQLLLCTNVDKSKVKEYVNHSVCWIKENQESLVYHGLNTLNTLAQKFLPLVQTADIPSIVKVIDYIVKTQADKLNFHLKEQYDIKRRQKIKDKLEEWTQILDNSLTTQTVSYCLPVCLELAEKLNILEIGQIKESIWTLCSHTVKDIHLKCFELSARIQIIMPDLHYFKCLKYNMETMVKLDSYESIPHLITIINSFKQSQEVLGNILILFRKVIHSFMKRVQKHKTEVKLLINILHSLLSDQQFKDLFIRQHQGTLFEILCKFINQKETFANIDESVNQKIEETQQLVKDVMTPGVFYKIISEMKKKQRQVRDDNRAKKNEKKIMDSDLENEEKLNVD